MLIERRGQGRHHGGETATEVGHFARARHRHRNGEIARVRNLAGHLAESANRPRDVRGDEPPDGQGQNRGGQAAEEEAPTHARQHLGHVVQIARGLKCSVRSPRNGDDAIVVAVDGHRVQVHGVDVTVAVVARGLFEILVVDGQHGGAGEARLEGAVGVDQLRRVDGLQQGQGAHVALTNGRWNDLLLVVVLVGAVVILAVLMVALVVLVVAAVERPTHHTLSRIQQ